MAQYKSSTKERDAFSKANLKNISGYVKWLDSTLTSAERKHCISVGNHYGRTTKRDGKNVCYYCGGNR